MVSPAGFLPDGLSGVHPEGGQARSGEQQGVLSEPGGSLHLPVLQGQPHAGHALRGRAVRQRDGTFSADVVGCITVSVPCVYPTRVI